MEAKEVSDYNDFINISKIAESKCIGIYEQGDTQSRSYIKTDASTGTVTTSESSAIKTEECKGSDMDIVEHAIIYCESEVFQQALSDFRNNHIEAFRIMAESKDPEESEQTLDQMSVFNSYTELIEDMLTSQFLKPNGYSGTEFFNQAQDVATGKFTPLFQEHKNLWFIELMQSWLDYKEFARQMCVLAKTS